MLEVIAKNKKDIELINLSHADRIEFCKDLDHGGLTPSIRKVKSLSKISRLPMMVMVRSQYESFWVSPEQLEREIKQIKKIAKTKARGIVWGAINKYGQIDEDALKKVIAAKGHLELTFHKAFDLVADKIAAAKILKYYEVTRILTSGGAGSPLDNRETLLELNKLGIEIIVGGGVNYEVAIQLAYANLKNIHIGRAAHHKSSWNKKISIENINKIKKLVR